MQIGAGATDRRRSPRDRASGVRDDDRGRAQPSRPSPSGVRRRRPHGRFFSAAISAASTSIQPRLPVPTTNIRSISAQQQPTQKTPWSTPMRNASRDGARPCQRDTTNANGVWHCSRQRYLSALNWKSARARQHGRADHPAVGDEPAACRGTAHCRAVVGRVRDEPEREPDGDEARKRRARQARAASGRAADDAAKDRQQRKRRRQHHRRDHQHPGERVQHRRHHDDRPAGTARHKRGERASVAPAAVVEVARRTGSRSTATRSPTRATRQREEQRREQHASAIGAEPRRGEAGARHSAPRAVHPEVGRRDDARYVQASVEHERALQRVVALDVEVDAELRHS